MRFICTIICWTLFLASAFAYEPIEEEKSEHRSEVYDLARNYIVETFNLQIVEESEFFPVRFNSKGVWGNFDSRVQELGDDWFEVKGWCVSLGQKDKKIRWSVVVHYRLEDPNAWRYRRLDEVVKNEPVFTSWRFGNYRSVPYIARAGAPEANPFPEWSTLVSPPRSKG